MTYNTFEEYLDYLLIEKMDYEAYDKELKDGNEKYYHLAERFLDISKFAYDEWEALFEHHGFYEMSAIGFYASMIESRREQEAEAKLNNLQ
ncbi:hypothetical protein, partial [Ostreibacterium oceani]